MSPGRAGRATPVCSIADRLLAQDALDLRRHGRGARDGIVGDRQAEHRPRTTRPSAAWPALAAVGRLTATSERETGPTPCR